MSLLNKLWNLVSGDDKNATVGNSSSQNTSNSNIINTTDGLVYKFNESLPEGQLLKQIITEKNQVYQEVGYQGFKYSLVTAYNEVKEGDLDAKKKLIFHMIEERIALEKVIKFHRNSNRYDWKKINKIDKTNRDFDELLALLIRGKQSFSDADYVRLFDLYRNPISYQGFAAWPIGFSLVSVDNYIKKNGLSDELKSFLEQMKNWSEFTPKYRGWGADVEKAKKKIQKILNDNGDTKEVGELKFSFNSGPIGIRMNLDLQKIDPEIKNAFVEILHLCAQASSSNPTKKFLSEVNTHIDKISIDKYKQQVSQWLEYFLETEPEEREHQYGYTYRTFGDAQNLKILRALVWTFVRFHDSSTLQLIGKVANKGYKKIPGVGPTSAVIGNAAVYTLANSKGLEGVSQLTKLKMKVTKPSIKKTIDKHLTKLSEKRNLTISQIEEMAVPDFGLSDGEVTKEFGDFKLNFKITGIGKTEMVWIKPDGGTQKSVPSAVKDSKTLNDKLKKFKKDTAEIKKVISAHRDRIDNSYLEQRVWDLDSIQKYYFNHGLISFLAKRLIWEVYENDKLSATVYWSSDSWKDVKDKPVDFSKLKDPQFKLWHPISNSIEEVMAWRDVIMNHEIVQPFKQAFREIYVLTDAELNTKTYSNRMAAHVLKQHQFNALAGLRGWKFTLMGAWDHGFDGIA
ncbi:MAG: DUF4132 domain-containing protein [Crocinitomicaceae bacterium]|nr:DUF4132 domain-containing protein [Crocinitomicaceae bacterium]